MPIVLDRHENAESRRRKLLALHELRRSLERYAAAGDPTPGGVRMAVARTQLVRELRELIAALDRRVPHVERAGEAAIAHDAAMLKAKALKRIAELAAEGVPSGSDSAAAPKKMTAK